MHAIARRNGKHNFAYLHGEVKPWHGLGQSLTRGAAIETWTKEAGLDYEVAMARVMYDAGGIRDFDKKSVIYRVGKNPEPFATVSDSYKIVQPAEVMEFFKGLTEAGDFELHTAGVLFKGQRIFAMAKVAEGTAVKDELIEPNLLLATSFDGTMATIAQQTSISVVCWNTLQAALSNNDGKGRVKIRHSSKFNADAVKKKLGISKDSWTQFIKQVNEMASTKIDTVSAEAFLEDTLRQVYKAPNPREGTVFQQIMAKFNGAGMGMELDSRKGTVWGLINAVSEYTDHNASKTDDRRLESAWFGLGANLKDVAFNKATKELV